MDTSSFERFRLGRDSFLAGKKSLSMLMLAGAIVLTACSGDQAPEQAASTPAQPAAPVAAEPAPAAAEAPPAEDEVGTQLAVSEALTVPELLDLARTAVSEKQLFVPPGQSAFEYYLRVVELAPDNLTAHNALIDFYPYALLYVEQRVAASDLTESERVLGLMQKADDGAPALPRLQREVAALRARKAAELEAKELAQQAAQQRAAAAAAAASAPISVAEPEVAPPPVVQEEAPEPVRPTPPPQPVVTAPAPEPVAPPPRQTEPVTTTPAAATLPPVISSVQPRYPPAAFRRRVSGSVEVAFTVLPDGSVTGVRVISAKPANVFDREAINAMERWRFAPSNRTTEGRRIFDFKME